MHAATLAKTPATPPPIPQLTKAQLNLPENRLATHPPQAAAANSSIFTTSLNFPTPESQTSLKTT
jgi:hypothetical protein